MSSGITPEVKWTRYYEEPWTSWHPAINGFPDTETVMGGKLRDVDGRKLYVGRALHGEELLPGKVSLADKAAYITHEGKVIQKEEYDVLFCDGYYWTPAKNGQVPENALEAGHTASGEKLYVGRARHQGALIPGKIQPSKGAIFIAVGEEEKSYKEYEACYSDAAKMSKEPKDKVISNPK